MPTLNLGILAHVDAGKTTLTERLLYDAGVLAELGSVDAGSTQTDTLALERRRGITIRSAVVSFAVGDTTVNLIDTPGHPDFIAEVERVLDVLDGVVLVVSAVEGVQAQTRVLMRTLHRLRLPTLLFVNKIDRLGARPDDVLESVRRRLCPNVVPMGRAAGLGSARATVTPFTADDADWVDLLEERLSEHDDTLLAAYVDGSQVPFGRLRSAVADQSRRALVHPVYLGSARTGVGVDALVAGVRRHLPAASEDHEASLAGSVFKVERGAAGERVAYVRVRSGTLRTRDRVRVGARSEQVVTSLRVLEHGGARPTDAVPAGRIATVWGLSDVRIGDAVGTGAAAVPVRHFPPPSQETVVVTRRPEDRGRLHVALTQLAEQDPLIGLHQDTDSHELSVRLYGEVQKEVLGATLAEEYGVEVDFAATTTVCIERPLGIGAAVERIRDPGNPFLATVGLRVEPAAVGAGTSFRLGMEPAMPPAFFTAVEEAVALALQQGLHGWVVTDCAVTMTHCGYWPRQSAMHATFDKSMSSTGRDFRQLTPLVLFAALAAARTAVYEPIDKVTLDLPDDALEAVLPVIGRLGGVPGPPAFGPGSCVLSADLPAARVQELRERLPSATSGEGLLESAFDHWAPVRAAAPSRRRSGADPLDREDYLRRLDVRAPRPAQRG